MRFLFAAITLATIVGGPAFAQPVALTAWNIADLHFESGVRIPGRAFSLPRDDEDFAVLKDVGQSPAVAADIFALQEVNGPKAIARVFDLAAFEPPCVEERYEEDLGKTGIAAEKADRIYTAILVRRGIFDTAECLYAPELSVIDRNPDARGRQTRGGAVARLVRNGKELFVLSVHMKSGCNNRRLDVIMWPGEDATARKQYYDCLTLSHHIDALESWVDRMERAGKALVVAGDFNRRFNREIDGTAGSDLDHFWADIDDGEPQGLDLTRLPATQHTTACWPGGFTEPIDFIVFNSRAAPAIDVASYVKSGFEGYADRYIPLPGTVVADAAGKRNRKLISDHCPGRVVIDFSLLP